MPHERRAHGNVGSAASPRSSWPPGRLSAVFLPRLGMTGRVVAVPRRRAPRAPGRARRAARRAHRRACRCSRRGRTGSRVGATAPRASPSTSTASRCRRRQRSADPRVPRRAAGLDGRSAHDAGRHGAAACVDRRRRAGVPVPASHRGHRDRARAAAPRRHDDRADRAPARCRSSFGWHPYLRLPGAPRSDWRLRLPARRHLTLDDRGHPDRRRRARAGRDRRRSGGERSTTATRSAATVGSRSTNDAGALGRAAVRRRLPVRAGVGAAGQAVRRARADDRADQRAGRRQRRRSSAAATRSPRPSR